MQHTISELRRLRAELELLTRYDERRRRRRADYGSGQRAHELRRRRHELGAFEYRTVREELERPTTPAELLEAWQRIGRRRSQREGSFGYWTTLLDELLEEYGLTDEVLREIVRDRMRAIRVDVEKTIARLELECERTRTGEFRAHGLGGETRADGRELAGQLLDGRPLAVFTDAELALARLYTGGWSAGTRMIDAELRRRSHCTCERPVMDVEHDAGCRRCGRPVDFTPTEPSENELALRRAIPAA